MAMTAPKMSSAAAKVMKTDILSPISQVCSHEGAGHAVALVHIREAVAAAEAVAIHDGLHQTADVEETDLVLKEEPDGLLVSTVGSAGAETALLDGLFAGGKAAEGLLVGHIEGQQLEGGEVQLRHDARHTGRVGQRILDGDAHIRHAQLGDDGVVAVLHRRVDDALALDNDLNFLRRQTEQPHSLNELEALVHQSGAVDGDLCTHVPVGMLEGIGLGLAPQLFGLHAEEGAAGGRQQNFGQALGALLILQALSSPSFLMSASGVAPEYTSTPLLVTLKFVMSAANAMRRKHLAPSAGFIKF